MILLLISSDFLASDYCNEIEMKRALERDRAGEARVIPVILRAVDWAGAEFSHLQALPTDGRPVTSWQNTDKAFTNVAIGIRDAVNSLRKSALPCSKAVNAGATVVPPPASNEPGPGPPGKIRVRGKVLEVRVSSYGFLGMGLSPHVSHPIPATTPQFRRAPRRTRLARSPAIPAGAVPRRR